MERILIIDDNEDLCEVLGLSLAADGYEVRTAKSSGEGLSRFKERPADLVIVDIFMPDRDGLETIGDLLKLSPALKIIAMSGGAELARFGDHLQTAVDAGAVKYLKKPFAVQDLHDCIRAQLSRPGEK